MLKRQCHGLCSESRPGYECPLCVPTWGGSIPVQQVVVLCGVKVHDAAGSIQQLLVAAGAGDAVVAVPAVASVVQLLRLHLAANRCPREEQGRGKNEKVYRKCQTHFCHESHRVKEINPIKG